MLRDDLATSALTWLLGRKRRRVPSLECAAKPTAYRAWCPWMYGGVVCTDAPEPEDIFWENLELDGSSFQTEQRALTSIVTVPVILTLILTLTLTLISTLTLT